MICCYMEIYIWFLVIIVRVRQLYNMGTYQQYGISLKSDDEEEDADAGTLYAVQRGHYLMNAL